jgi:hypothetical protein
VSVFKDKSGIDESVRIAQEWISKNASHIGAAPPTVVEERSSYRCSRFGASDLGGYEGSAPGVVFRVCRKHIAGNGPLFETDKEQKKTTRGWVCRVV